MEDTKQIYSDYLNDHPDSIVRLSSEGDADHVPEPASTSMAMLTEMLNILHQRGWK
jgi:hypothetical protein